MAFSSIGLHDVAAVPPLPQEALKAQIDIGLKRMAALAQAYLDAMERFKKLQQHLCGDDTKDDSD